MLAKPVAQAFNAAAFGAVVAAVELAVLRLQAMADDLAAAMVAGRGQGVDRALETIEGVSAAAQGDLKGFVILIPADFALCHRSFLSCPAEFKKFIHQKKEF